MKKCKVCNIIVEDENVYFCEKCGNKLVDEDTEKQFCIKCGSPLDLDDLYCPSCGSKVEQQSSLVEDKKVKMCPICASFIDEDCEVCLNCGYSFSEISQNKNDIVEEVVQENEINTNEKFSEDNQINEFCSQNETKLFGLETKVQEEKYNESITEIITNEDDNENKVCESSNDNTTKKYCSKCGTALELKTIYCSECGYKQEETNEILINEAPRPFIQPIAKYECPEDSEYYCPNCGRGEKNNTVFCKKCKSVLVKKSKLAFSYVEDELTKKQKRIRENRNAHHQQELTKYYQDEQNNVLKYCWYIFGLCFTSVFTGLGFVIFFVMIAGIFFSKKQLKIFKYLLSPMNIHVVKNTKKHFFLNSLWFILGGFIVILLFRIVQCLLCITIFGMPIAKQMNKFVEFFKSPFSAKIISNKEFSCENIKHAVYSRQFIMRNSKLSIFQPNVLEIKKAEKKIQRKKNWLFVLFFFIFLIGFVGLYLAYIFKLSFVEFIFDSYYFEFFNEYSTYIFLAIIGLFFAIAFYCSIGRRMVKRIVVYGYGTKNELTEIFDKKKYYPENNRVFKAYLKLYIDYKDEIDNFIKNEE